MIISKPMAQALNSSTAQAIIFGIGNLLGLFIAGYNIVTSEKDIYELIYQAELLMTHFFFVVTNFSQYFLLNDEEYVFNMSFLTKEFQHSNQNIQFTFQEMIKNQSRGSVSICSQFYARIKMEFHNFFCESHDFIYLIIGLFVVIQGMFNYKNIDFNLFVLIASSVFYSFFCAIGLMIEMPRRISQSIKLKRLVNQLGQQEQQRAFLNLQIETNLLRSNLLQSEEEIQIEFPPQQPQPQVVNQQPEEEVCCAICQEILDENQDLKKLQCHPTHIFHIGCILGWKNRAIELNRAPTCPICRKPMDI